MPLRRRVLRTAARGLAAAFILIGRSAPLTPPAHWRSAPAALTFSQGARCSLAAMRKCTGNGCCETPGRAGRAFDQGRCHREANPMARGSTMPSERP